MHFASWRRTFIVIGILVFCAAWRLTLLQQMPCISRDGVLYCEFARELVEHGLSVLRDPGYAQHPLFPLCILGVQRVLVHCGAKDGPLAWQAAGQFVAFSAGLGLILLTGWLTARAARELGVTAGGPALWAILLCGLLPLNMWLSVDCMSEPLFLLLFVTALGLAVSAGPFGDSAGVVRGLAIGLSAGLAFLVRPEGGIVALAGAATILSAAAFASVRFRSLMALLFGFALCAGPYMILIGGISPKMNKQTVGEFRVGKGPDWPEFQTLDGPRLQGPTPIRAALVRHNRPWYLIVPWVVYETLRSGRVVVPVLALLAAWPWRRRLLHPPLLPLSLTAMLVFSLCAWLATRHGYLDPRHTLLITMVCIPTAAILLARMTAWACINDGMRPTRRLFAGAVTLGTVLPLGLYSLRVPNAVDRPLREVAEWARINLENRDAKLLIGGTSERRISFYAGMRWQGWPENEPSETSRFEKLRAHIHDYPADFVALRAGPGAELVGNQALLERLQRDPQMSGRLRLLHETTGPDGARVLLFAYDSRS